MLIRCSCAINTQLENGGVVTHHRNERGAAADAEMGPWWDWRDNGTKYLWREPYAICSPVRYISPTPTATQWCVCFKVSRQTQTDPHTGSIRPEVPLYFPSHTRCQSQPFVQQTYKWRRWPCSSFIVFPLDVRDQPVDVFNLMTEGITRNIFKGLFGLRLLSWLVNSQMDSSYATDHYF